MEKQKNTNAFRDTIFDVIDNLNPEQETEHSEDGIETLF